MTLCFRVLPVNNTSFSLRFYTCFAIIYQKQRERRSAKLPAAPWSTLLPISVFIYISDFNNMFIYALMMQK